VGDLVCGKYQAPPRSEFERVSEKACANRRLENRARIKKHNSDKAAR
jgi:hypothetical protein